MSYSYQSYETASFSPPGITWGVHRLIVATIAVFALQLILDPLLVLLPVGRLPAAGPGGFLNLWLGFEQKAFLTGWLYTPITYQFLHSGLLHLFMNMLWLYFFGPDVERAVGTRQFFRLYLTCGGLGVLLTLVPFLLFGESTLIMGASGAVMGVMVAFAVIDPQRQFHLFPLPIPITAVGLVVIVAAMQLVAAIGESPISVATHIGGMITGFLYMKTLPQVVEWQRQRARRQRTVKRSPRTDTGKVGEAVDNIFKFKDPDR